MPIFLDSTKWEQANPKKLEEARSLRLLTQVHPSELGIRRRHPLNAQGYATQFATSSVMKPQT
jgi:hypothetical protein